MEKTNNYVFFILWSTMKFIKLKKYNVKKGIHKEIKTNKQKNHKYNFFIFWDEILINLKTVNKQMYKNF